jgi:hypothetical protein
MVSSIVLVPKTGQRIANKKGKLEIIYCDIINAQLIALLLIKLAFFLTPMHFISHSFTPLQLS